MKVQVVGIRKVEFTDKERKQLITGNTLYCLKKDDYVVGFEGIKFFVKSSIDISNLKINDNIEIFFNQKGKVDSLTVLK